MPYELKQCAVRLEQMAAEIVGSRLKIAGAGRKQLPLPGGVKPPQLEFRYTIAVASYHLMALLAFVPWLFSWTGVVLAVAGIYVFGGLGINLCYHRLLAHRGLTCPKWLEHWFAILGVCCLQDTPARWVAVHRRHHHHADEQQDPHSPLVNFFWGHMGWLLVKNKDLNRLGIYDRYAKDVLRDRFYVMLDRNYFWVLIGSWIVFFYGGFVAELLLGGSVMEAVQFGASVLLWGVVVRTVLVWHITWSVNSLAHIWGYRNYETDEDSRNNMFVAVITSGEGWHNNHHADPRAAKHGHRWWELDGIYLAIRFLAMVGLAQNVVMPNPRLTASRGDGRLATREYAELVED
jgi:fatty-acid desaturase